MFCQPKVTRLLSVGVLCISLFCQSPGISHDEPLGNDMAFVAGGFVLGILFVFYGLYTIGGKYQMPDGNALFPENYIRYQRSSDLCHKQVTHGAKLRVKEKGIEYLCPDSIQAFKGTPYTQKKQVWFRKQLRPTFNDIYHKSKANSVALNARYHALVSLCANVDKWNKEGIPLLSGCIKQVFKEIRGDKYNQYSLNNSISYDQGEVFEHVCSYLPEFSVSNSDLHSQEWKLYCLQSGYGNSLVRQ